jgi:hypothetical protein
MRETEILRGLHKARATMRQRSKSFADGMLPSSDQNLMQAFTPPVAPEAAPTAIYG